MSNLTSLVQKLAGTYKADKVLMFDAKVLEVYENKRTCKVVTIGGASSNELEVRLMASVDDGALKIPAINSTVVVIVSYFVEPLVMMFSEIEKIVWLGGEFGGVPIVSDPNNPNKGVLKKLNNIEHDINNLKNIFSSWLVTPNDGGGALKTAAAIWFNSEITATNAVDIEHEKIKQ